MTRYRSPKKHTKRTIANSSIKSKTVVTEKPISRAKYMLKNYWFPMIILGIISIVGAVSAFRDEAGGKFVFLFTVCCYTLMIFLGFRSYTNYVNQLNIKNEKH
jgi:hypothetical protein